MKCGKRRKGRLERMIPFAMTLLVLYAPAMLFGQSLGDAARKEQERRKKNAETGVKSRSVDDEGLRSTTVGGTGTYSTPGQLRATTPASDPSGAGTIPSGTPPPTSTGGISDSDKLRGKIAAWRNQYQPVKAQVDKLVREVAELEAKASQIVGVWQDKSLPSGPQKTEAEVVLTRLPQAKSELVTARKNLANIEDAARRDGVTAGQLD